MLQRLQVFGHTEDHQHNLQNDPGEDHRKGQEQELESDANGRVQRIQVQR